MYAKEEACPGRDPEREPVPMRRSWRNGAVRGCKRVFRHLPVAALADAREEGSIIPVDAVLALSLNVPQSRLSLPLDEPQSAFRSPCDMPQPKLSLPLFSSPAPSATRPSSAVTRTPLRPPKVPVSASEVSLAVEARVCRCCLLPPLEGAVNTRLHCPPSSHPKQSVAEVSRVIPTCLSCRVLFKPSVELLSASDSINDRLSALGLRRISLARLTSATASRASDSRFSSKAHSSRSTRSAVTPLQRMDSGKGGIRGMSRLPSLPQRTSSSSPDDSSHGIPSLSNDPNAGRCGSIDVCVDPAFISDIQNPPTLLQPVTAGELASAPDDRAWMCVSEALEVLDSDDVFGLCPVSVSLST